jgi:hypothetical protein
MQTIRFAYAGPRDPLWPDARDVELGPQNRDVLSMPSRPARRMPWTLDLAHA